METTTAAPRKGNIVTGRATGATALVLAITRDGKRAKLHVYGADADVWKDVDSFDITTAGLEDCFKCNGSGLFYSGGMILNGVYTGRTGNCYACGGKGKCDDADRIRNHFYYRDHFRISA